MDRRYSSSSTASATKKPSLNASIRFRNSSDLNLNHHHHRKSFPSASSSSDLATSNNQVCVFIILQPFDSLWSSLSTFCRWRWWFHDDDRLKSIFSPISTKENYFLNFHKMLMGLRAQKVVSSDSLEKSEKI